MTKRTLNNNIDESMKLFVDEIECNRILKWKVYFSKESSIIELNKPLESYKERYIKILKKVAPVLLKNEIFRGSDLRISDKRICITTTTNKMIDVTNYIDDNSKNFGIEIVKSLSRLNIGDDDICPIYFDNAFKAIRDGIKISCIKGERTPYIHDALVKICNEQGISPITREPFSLSDIVEYKHNSTLELPINSIIEKDIEVEFSNINKIRKTETNKKEAKPINLICLVDISGSMYDKFEIVNVASDPLVNFIKNLHDESYISLITFNQDVKECFKFKKVKEMKLDSGLSRIQNYLEPGGSTSLYQAISETILKWDQYKKLKLINPNDLDEYEYDESTEKNLLFIITDGIDSKSYNWETWKSKMDDLTKDCWEKIDCYFMHPRELNGPNFLNLSKDQCLTFDNTEENTKNAIEGMSQIANVYSNSLEVEPITDDIRVKSLSCERNFNSMPNMNYNRQYKSLSNEVNNNTVQNDFCWDAENSSDEE